MTVMEGKSLYPLPCRGECVVENGSMIFITEDGKGMSSKRYRFFMGGEGNSCPPEFAVLSTDFPGGLHFSCGLAIGVSMDIYVEKISPN